MRKELSRSPLALSAKGAAAPLYGMLLKAIAAQDRPKKDDKCPTDLAATKALSLTTKGCTLEEAERKMYRKYLDACKGVVSCKGTCEEGECTAFVLPDADSGLVCVIAEIRGCPDGVGYICRYQGPLVCGCDCA